MHPYYDNQYTFQKLGVQLSISNAIIYPTDGIGEYHKSVNVYKIKYQILYNHFYIETKTSCSKNGIECIENSYLVS